MLRNFKIVLPGGDSIDVSAHDGEPLSNCINRVLQEIEPCSIAPVDESCLLTCVVNLPSKDITEATAQEKRDLVHSHQWSEGYRYSHTYFVDASLDNMTVMLNILRVYYHDKNNNILTLYPYIGENMTDLRERRKNNMDRAFSCGGSLSCASCHVYIGSEYFNIDSLKGGITCDEEDLLDVIQGQSELSRLGCQINFSPELDKIRILHPNNDLDLAQGR